MNHADNEKYSPWITFQVFLWTFFGLLPAFLLPLLFDYLVWRFKLDGYWNFIFFVIYMGYLLLVKKPWFAQVTWQMTACDIITIGKQWPNN